ncbi:MAG: Sulfate/thiosulfate import ATP-binding protein CysA [Smithella sp. PtaU1.Bin162]|nr:MAG: Sulfate/thiosulfate import ATP-binding protein CysA [Smithella sp. PtaU1.Bin162]
MSEEYLLQTLDLTKSFGSQVAVNKVNLNIKKGEFVSIIGPNGAGKTTFFNLVSGAFKPDGGKIYFKGQDITRTKEFKRVQMGMARCFQITNVFPHISVLENVRLAVQAKSKNRYQLFMNADKLNDLRAYAYYCLEMVQLKTLASHLAVNLTHANQRKLEIAIQLASQGELLLLDEPTAGMSAEEVPAIIEVVKEIKEKEEKTIVMVEHKLNIVLSLSDHIAVMNYGALIAYGAPQKIKENRDVQNAYLGKEVGA